MLPPRSVIVAGAVRVRYAEWPIAHCVLWSSRSVVAPRRIEFVISVAPCPQRTARAAPFSASAVTFVSWIGAAVLPSRTVTATADPAVPVVVASVSRSVMPLPVARAAAVPAERSTSWAPSAPEVMSSGIAAGCVATISRPAAVA